MEKRVRRLTRVVLVLAIPFLVFAALTWVERESEGPMAQFLSGMGAPVSWIEKSATEYIRGPCREKKLKWFDALNNAPAAPRYPPHILLGAYERPRSSFNGRDRGTRADARHGTSPHSHLHGLGRPSRSALPIADDACDLEPRVGAGRYMRAVAGRFREQQASASAAARRTGSRRPGEHCATPRSRSRRSIGPFTTRPRLRSSKAKSHGGIRWGRQGRPKGNDHASFRARAVRLPRI